MSTTPDQTDAPDPLAKLHRMSTTAGVASQQYVAVNNTAIIAVVLGVASGLAMLDKIMLFIPAIGIVVAIVAWHQIRNSNRTETGLPWAILGLLLSFLIGAGVSAKEISARRRLHSDVEQMSSLLHDLQGDLVKENYEAAYQRFDILFRQRIPLQLFEGRWRAYQRPTVDGPLKEMAWNGVPPIFENVKGGDEIVAVMSVIVRFQSFENGRFTFVFRNTGGGWQLEDMPDMFPQKKGNGP